MGRSSAARGRNSYFDLEHLHCYGCAHSAAGEPWPSRPSGERPCGFCVRNREAHLYMDDYPRTWYDGSEPVALPMDCYQTVDMRQQVGVWVEEAEAKGTAALKSFLEAERILRAGKT